MASKTTTQKRKRAPRPTRGYTRAFTPRGDGRDFKINRIPAGFWTQVQTKAKRDGVSLRGLILTYLQDWVHAAA